MTSTLPTKNKLFSNLFCLFHSVGTFKSVFKDKSQNEVTKRQKERFLLIFFCFLSEGSGSEQIKYGSGFRTLEAQKLPNPERWFNRIFYANSWKVKNLIYLMGEISSVCPPAGSGKRYGSRSHSARRSYLKDIKCLRFDRLYWQTGLFVVKDCWQGFLSNKYFSGSAWRPNCNHCDILIGKNCVKN